ncbi:MAG: SDR family oxidoreductase [Deltaproteobacteria bacterium]|jgi:pteridine reductase|nr:SDR family oxidoreductase [Deltaproteobacteria bacterium]
MRAALITGGVNRLGKAIGLFLAGKGYHIAIHHQKSDPAALIKEIEKSGVAAVPFQADLNNEFEMEKLIPAVIKCFPQLEILVNNASIFEPGDFKEIDFLQLNRYLNINFKAPFILSRELFKQLKSGNIINMVDAKITHQQHNFSTYLLSKKILMAFTEMAAVEFGPQMRINAIAPGAILPPPGKDESYLKERDKETVLKKIGSKENIIQAVDFLIKNTFITGQCIYIDGGTHLI